MDRAERRERIAELIDLTSDLQTELMDQQERLEMIREKIESLEGGTVPSGRRI